MPFDEGQEGVAIGVEEGATTVDEVLELDTTDELEVDSTELDATDELELDTLDEEVPAELEGIVDVLKEVMDGVVLELEALELPETDIETVLVLAVVVALEPVATELEIVVIGRTYPAILVLSRLAVLAKD